MPGMSNQISPGAEQAREGARQKSGRFGTQHHSSPGSDVLDDFSTGSTPGAPKAEQDTSLYRFGEDSDRWTEMAHQIDGFTPKRDIIAGLYARDKAVGGIGGFSLDGDPVEQVRPTGQPAIIGTTLVRDYAVTTKGGASHPVTGYVSEDGDAFFAAPVETGDDPVQNRVADRLNAELWANGERNLAIVGRLTVGHLVDAGQDSPQQLGGLVRAKRLVCEARERYAASGLGSIADEITREQAVVDDERYTQAVSDAKKVFTSAEQMREFEQEYTR